MSDNFDPYYRWLGIPPEEQPPNHYRLLGVRLYEEDIDVLTNAADQRLRHVRTFQHGKNVSESQQVLNKLSAAQACLLDPKKKADYDAQLRRELAPATPVSPVADAAALPTPSAPRPRLQVAKPITAAPVSRNPGIALPEGSRPPIPAVSLGSGGPASAHLPGPQPAPDAPMMALVVDQGPSSSHSSRNRSHPSRSGNSGAIVASIVGVCMALVVGGAVFYFMTKGGSNGSVVNAGSDRGKGGNESLSSETAATGTAGSGESRPGSTASPSSHDKKSISGATGESGPVRSGVASDPIPEAGVQGQEQAVWEAADGTIRLRQLQGRQWTKEVKRGPGTVAIEMVRTAQAVYLWDQVGRTIYRAEAEQVSQWNRNATWTPVAKGTWVRPFAPAPTVGDPDARQVWHYTGHGEFRRRPDGNWGEINPNDQRGAFAEIARNPTQVLLFDSSRGIFVLLTDTATSWSRGIDLNWNGAASGRWENGSATAAVSPKSPDTTSDPPETPVGPAPLKPPVAVSPKPNPEAGSPSDPASKPKASGVGTPDTAFILDVPAGSSIEFGGAAPPLAPKSSATIELWFKPSPDKGREIPLLDLPGWLNLRWQQYGQTPTVSFQSMQGNDFKSLRAAPSDDWHHLAVQIDAPARRARLFLDGQKLSEFSYLSRDTSDEDRKRGWFLGSSQRQGNYADFQVRGFRISSEAIYTGDTFTPPATFSRNASTVVLFDFSKASTTAIADLSGKGNHGKLNDAVLVAAAPAPKPGAPDPFDPATTPTPATPSRLPLPKEDALAKARAQLKDIYGEDIKKATKPDAKKTLGGEMIKVARAEKDAAVRYALLVAAEKILASIPDIAAALEACSDRDREFEIDGPLEQVALIREMGERGSLTPAARDELIEAAAGIARRAVSEERWEMAASAADAAWTLASPTRESDLKRDVRALRDSIATQGEQQKAVAKAVETLKTTPADPVANGIVGRYCTLVREQWSKGLPFLVLASDAALADAAKKELAAAAKMGGEAVGPRLDSAEAWLNLAKDLKDNEQAAVLRHAQQLVEQALSEAEGLLKIKAEKLAERAKKDLADYEKAHPTAAPKAIAAANKPIYLPGILMRVFAGPTGGEKPTQLLATLRTSDDLTRYMFTDEIRDLGRGRDNSVQVLLAGYLVLPQDATVNVTLQYCRALVDKQEVKAASAYDTFRSAIPLKKATYRLLIKSTAGSARNNYPVFRFEDAKTGQNLMFYSDQELKTEMDRTVTPLNGPPSKGVMIKPRF